MKVIKKTGDSLENGHNSERKVSSLEWIQVAEYYNYTGLSLNAVQIQQSSDSTIQTLHASDYNEHLRFICLARLKLTVREVDCYFLLAQGYRSKEIARKLSISYRTVEKHIENIKERLQCNTLAAIFDKVNRCLYEELS